MATRREFLKGAAALAGGAMFWSVPDSIRRAVAIAPDPGTTFLDAEHIVILMQENRSFDHSYGALRGVRGFNDPRAHVLPNGNPVWLQTNQDGETYAPFRLDIKETNITWIGGLPHSWGNQVDARNDGAYDKWLIAKPSGYKDLAKKPMTLGHYTRDDIPFYYALADAFTICDQNFCSSLTGTTPNRFYLWTGTIRPEQSPEAKAHVYNEELDHGHLVNWTTFPERLEDAGVSWKIYQNEIDLPTGMSGEANNWLCNFGCNPIEYVSQFNVRYSPRHRQYLSERVATLAEQIAALEAKPQPSPEDQKKLTTLKAERGRHEEALATWTQEKWEMLSERDRNLHRKAFTTNEGDPHFRDLDELEYQDAGVKRNLKVPRGDVFHQFRKDVEEGTLPTVSWLVSPESFSDHPSSAWFGAWYISEALDILTKNPEVWKKTIFILTYDENDGYFDHVPPFVAPNPYRAEAGKVSRGIDPKVEFITKEQDIEFRPRYKPRESAIGLGYRVPLVVASPWSRGGCVCSQVFDHTSVLQFLEVFLSHKTGKKIEEPNISAWRRAVCGDLTSIFEPYTGQPIDLPPVIERDPFVESIHRAKFKQPPTGFQMVPAADVEAIRQGSKTSPNVGTQEPGTRKARALPYELYVDGDMSADGTELVLRFRSGDKVFGKRSAGSAFNAYAYRRPGDMQFRAFATEPGTSVTDSWRLTDFADGRYLVRVDGPNGFMRSFWGDASGPRVDVRVAYALGSQGGPNGELHVALRNPTNQDLSVTISDEAYGMSSVHRKLPAGGSLSMTLATAEGWYDWSVRIDGDDRFERRFAGHVETGQASTSDPAMGSAKRR
jgi:phospholipase C